MTVKKSVVIWTVEEKETLCKAAATLLAGERSRGKTMTAMQALTVAQRTALAPGRRRPALTQPYKAAALLARIDTLMNAGAAPEPSEPAAVEPVIEPSPASIADATEPIPDVEPPVIVEMDPVVDIAPAKAPAAKAPPAEPSLAERYGYRANTAGLLAYLKDFPGGTAPEMGRALGWDANTIAGLLGCQLNRKGEARVARVATVKGETRFRVFKWYLTENLPEDVRRSIDTALDEARQKREAEEAKAAAKAAQLAAKTEPAAEPEAPPAEAEAVEPEALAEAPELDEAAPITEDFPADTFDAPTSTAAPPAVRPFDAGPLQPLIMELAHRLAAHVLQEMETALAGGIAHLLQSLPPAVTPPATTLATLTQDAVARAKRPTLRKVLIVGLHNGNAAALQKEFGDRLDLRCCDPDVSLQTLQEKVQVVDEAVLVCNFVSHSHADAMRLAKKWHRLHGGMTRVREYLAKLVAQPA